MNSLAIFFFFLIIYPYLIYPLIALLLGFLRNKKVEKKEIYPRVCMMIAAYNEEKSIEAKIENSLKLDYPNELLNIVVVSDGSSDRTDAIVQKYGEHGVELIRVEGRLGKTEARNIALREIKDEIILFSDATTIYEKDIVKKIVRNFADPSVGMVSARLQYLSSSAGDMDVGQSVFWKIECMIKNAQMKFSTLTGSLGCASAFRRKEYVELPPHIIEDFTEPLMIIQKGFRVVYEHEARCYEYATEKSGQEWRMRVRVICGGLLGMMHAKKVLNPMKYPAPSFQLISHKLLRWLAGPNAILCFIFSCIATISGNATFFVKALYLSQIFFLILVGTALVFEKVPEIKKIISMAKYFFILNAASVAAIFKTIALPAKATWETERGEENGATYQATRKRA